MKENKGITLVALIITIIVMMILVAVSVSIIINSDLLGTAQNAGRSYKEKADAEGNLSGDDVQIIVGGETYDSLDAYKQTLCTHTYGEWETTREASYSKAGEKERTCIKCGIPQTQPIPKLECTEHTYRTGVDFEVDEENCLKYAFHTVCGQLFYATEDASSGWEVGDPICAPYHVESVDGVCTQCSENTEFTVLINGVEYRACYLWHHLGRIC